jgi:restriction endonuclease S subunit
MHHKNGAKQMLNTLSDLATVKGGHPFRGKIPENKDGDAFAIQIKDINELGKVDWNNLISTSLLGRKTPDWLAEGDVLFAARGLKNIAVSLDQVTKPTVCGPHFFVIQVKQGANILPEFLAWQLNQIPAQKYFTQSAEGSAQLSIRRAVVEATPITIPSMDKQQTIVAFNRAAQQEKKKLLGLIENRNNQMHGIAQKTLLKN